MSLSNIIPECVLETSARSQVWNLLHIQASELNFEQRQRRKTASKNSTPKALKDSSMSYHHLGKGDRSRDEVNLSLNQL